MKTMAYLTNTSFLTAGVELEFHNKRGLHRSIDGWRTLLTDAGFDWLLVKYDGSANVDVEIVFPPMPAHGAGGAMADISAVMQFIETNGGKVSKKGCGLHVHIGNRAVKRYVHPLTIGRIPKAQWQRQARFSCLLMINAMTLCQWH